MSLKLLIIYPSQLYAPHLGKSKPLKAHMINLFSFLRHNKIEVDVLDLENEIGRPTTNDALQEFKKRAAEIISNLEFNAVAISCYSSFNYLSTIMVAEICKHVNSDSAIAVGGYHPSALPGDFKYKNSPFDFIVRGEGEIALLKICKGMKRINKNPRIIQGSPLNLKENFLLDWRNYKYFDPSRHSDIYLSRGCPFHCAFCSETSKGCSKWRSYTVDKALKEIKELIDIRNPKQIGIADACFGFCKRWRRDFLESLIRNKIDKIFVAESRVDLLDKLDIDLFSKLNFKMIFGLESGSEKMLRIMWKAKKPKNYLKRCKDILSYMNKMDVPYKIYLIFNHPGETRRTYADTIKFLESIVNKDNKISGFLAAQDYAFFPGSHIYMNLKQYKKEYGTIVKYTEWWKEPGDHNKLARQVVPSADLLDMPNNKEIWEKDISNLNRRIFEKMPLAVKILL